MSYTPINWQNGDVITAEKLNKMDRGWDTVETTLFNETVTTVENQGLYGSILSYIFTEEPPETLTITFDGADYQCQRITDTDEGYYYYGELGLDGPDFTNYPFILQVANMYQAVVITETAGTYTISAKTASMVCSDEFEEAVKTAQVGPLLVHINSEPGVLDKTWQEIYNAAPMVYLCINDESVDYFLALTSIKGEEAPYGVSFLNSIYTLNMYHMEFSTESPSGFPVLVNDGDDDENV